MESERESVTKIIYRFPNECASSVRTIMVADIPMVQSDDPPSAVVCGQCGLPRSHPECESGERCEKNYVGSSEENLNNNNSDDDLDDDDDEWRSAGESGGELDEDNDEMQEWEMVERLAAMPPPPSHSPPHQPLSSPPHSPSHPSKPSVGSGDHGMERLLSDDDDNDDDNSPHSPAKSARLRNTSGGVLDKACNGEVARDDHLFNVDCLAGAANDADYDPLMVAEDLEVGPDSSSASKPSTSSSCASTYFSSLRCCCRRGGESRGRKGGGGEEERAKLKHSEAEATNRDTDQGQRNLHWEECSETAEASTSGASVGSPHNQSLDSSLLGSPNSASARCEQLEVDAPLLHCPNIPRTGDTAQVKGRCRCPDKPSISLLSQYIDTSPALATLLMSKVGAGMYRRLLG